MPTGLQVYLSCFQEAGKPLSTRCTWKTASVQASWEWKLLEEQNPFWTSELGSSIYTVGTPEMSSLTFQKEVAFRGCSWCSPHRAISYFRARSFAPGTKPPNHHDKPHAVTRRDRNNDEIHLTNSITPKQDISTQTQSVRPHQEVSALLARQSPDRTVPSPAQ